MGGNGKRGAKRKRGGRAEEQVVLATPKKAKVKAKVLAATATVQARPESDPRPRAFKDPAGSALGPRWALTEEDDGAVFLRCRARSYPGFACEQVKSKALRSEVNAALERLRREGYFHYDVLAYGGKVNVTRVQRALVGKPGMTYLYQSLRLFALPWTDSSIAGGALRPIERLNAHLEKRGNALIEAKRAEGGHVAASAGVGRCDYNLTLINAALTNAETAPARPGGIKAPPVQPVLPFKSDKRFPRSRLKLAVNWHKDSTLEPFSTIGVYHHTPDESSRDWEIAMCCEREGLAPPLRAPLADGDSYFMLGNFNHHHQHAVVAGRCARYASTHRVALTQGATFDAISARCASVTGPSAARWKRGEALDSRRVRCVGELATELELQWIRMFYCQGGVHQKQHETWWAPRIEQMVGTWGVLEQELREMVDHAIAKGKPGDASAKKALRMLVYVLETRHEGRAEWRRRLDDEAYRLLPEAYRPIERPDCASEGSFPFDLEPVLRRLRAIEARSS